jgi:hypothetical protein
MMNKDIEFLCDHLDKIYESFRRSGSFIFGEMEDFSNQNKINGIRRRYFLRSNKIMGLTKNCSHQFALKNGIFRCKICNIKMSEWLEHERTNPPSNTNQ